jgi:hypothetical protein
MKPGSIWQGLHLLVCISFSVKPFDANLISITDKGVGPKYANDDQYLWTATQNCQALLQFFCTMFNQIDDFKECIVQKHIVEDLISIQFSLFDAAKISMKGSTASIKDANGPKVC